MNAHLGTKTRVKAVRQQHVSGVSANEVPLLWGRPKVELLDLLGDEGILNLPLLERLQQLDQQPGFEELTVDREALRTFCQ